MARYFFHIVNSTFEPDTIGTECSSAEEVKSQAVKAAGEALRDQALAVWSTGRWYMFVADEQNMTRLKLEFTAEDLTAD